MYVYQPLSSSAMLRFAKRPESGVPRCIRCGQPFHMFFSRGQLIEQHCGCGLVYRVETMAVQDFVEGNANAASRNLDG